MNTYTIDTNISTGSIEVFITNAVNAVPFGETVNVVPQPKAGGSFATAAYAAVESPVEVLWQTGPMRR